MDFAKGRPAIVAELSGNHEGSLERCMRLMDLAHENGADAVKIQTYTEDSLTLDSDRPEFQITGGLWKGQTLYELYKKAKTPREWVKPLFKHAREHGIRLFSTPFSFEDLKALEDAGCPCYKIASFELNYVQLISECARTFKPMVISTGLGTQEEIDRAVEAARQAGCRDLTLLVCQSSYPADPAKFSLRTIPYLKERYGCKAGLSDHALGDVQDIAATALGADMIEKHFTDDRSRGSVDAAFSMEPSDLRKLASDTAEAAASLGVYGVRLTPEEQASRGGRRSVYLVKKLKKGDVLTEDCVRIVRPACGMKPYQLHDVLGRKAKMDLDAPIPLERKFFC